LTPATVERRDASTTDRAERWNELEYSQEIDGLVAHDSG
jgi:hypothetical protein